ncbi:unnamed protein product [Orchesella dallaii]|uniref:RalBP1-associated Eps domain-containing protein 1 n=1 Tax=Orchesella dallaii TaxID=48710 RepID=A0ABP1R5D7_9HEXA
MEVPISKFVHVQKSDTYWHQPNTTSAFKSPDLIELNSDSERNSKPVEPLHYSSSQEEVETEDDCCDGPESSHIKDTLAGVYDVTSNDEESCHLLQTEDDSENSESEHGENSSNSSVSHSSSSACGTISDGEAAEDQAGVRIRQNSLENYWDMSVEQEKYYTEQFHMLQPDHQGLVNGIVAKGFFEKSKLPHLELREIWQLADVTRDGCLDLNEFKMAMHLVVLRRHNLPIPSHFYNRPPDFALTAGNSINAVYQPSKKASSKTSPKNPASSGGPSTSATLATHDKQSSFSSKRPSKEWTTFENEPVNFSSTCDTSGLVAPVPVRLSTPEDKLLMNNNSGSASASKAQQLQLKAIQRPKLSGQHPKISTGTIAPPPPPRRKTHVRSSSLDLNRLNISSDVSQTNCTAMGGCPEVPNRSFLSPSHQGGAFSVYRKPQAPRTSTIHEPFSIPSGISKYSDISVRSNVEDDIVELKAENVVLSRVANELLQQLSAIQTRRRIISFKINELNDTGRFS